MKEKKIICKKRTRKVQGGKNGKPFYYNFPADISDYWDFVAGTELEFEVRNNGKDLVIHLPSGSQLYRDMRDILKILRNQTSVRFTVLIEKYTDGTMLREFDMNKAITKLCQQNKVFRQGIGTSDYRVVKYDKSKLEFMRTHLTP